MASSTINRRRKKAKVAKGFKLKPISVPVRLFIVLALLTLALVGIITRLVYLQIFVSNDRIAAQVDQLVDEVQIPAERGNIYDRNLNILVQDSSAKSVNIIPKLVKEPTEVSKKLSKELGLDYDKVYKIVTKLEDDKVEINDQLTNVDTVQLMSNLSNPEAYEIDEHSFYCIPDQIKSVKTDTAVIAQAFGMSNEKVESYLTAKENTAQVIKTKVDNALAEELKESLAVYDDDGEVTSYNGIELLEDKMRYYTNGNFASYILGFTGNDHSGLYGVERTFNNQLSGRNGIVYYQKDAYGNIINSQTKVVQEATRGEDLVLSIDSNIQSAAEKTLENAVNQWHAKSGVAIVMDTDTGEIIAMASKPDYDLNNPYSISDEFKARHEEDLKELSETDQLENMWKNPAVSFIYEPGSTFKPITISTALEEGAINPSMTFTCTGAITIAGTTINCTGVHGTQTVAETLENSCNPGLVQIISDLNPNTFYKYVYNLGFGTRTGIELTGEEEGIVGRPFAEDGSINMVDYSTFSFGQGLATTPIQILCALNSLINDGYYISPTLLKTSQTKSTKQVISDSTSREIREAMHGMIESQTILKNQAGNFQIGGKSGTAEKFVDGEYSTEKFVTSFFCFAPVDDPKYATIVVLDEPDTGTSGSASAGPAAIDILKQALIYSGSNPQADSSNNVVVPDLIGMKIDSATKILEERNITYTINENGEGDYVLAQSIPAQTEYLNQEKLVITVGPKPENVEMMVPDFTGMTIQSVNEKVQELGIHLVIKGNGFAVEQSIAPGTIVEPDSTITVRFKE